MRLMTTMNLSNALSWALEKTQGYDITIRLTKNAAVGPQGYRRTCGEMIEIAASDEAGFFYGILDLAEDLERGAEITDYSTAPRLLNRGIKFNIPLDSRTPSYSDASTSANRNIRHMWEKEFWHEFLDRMALDHYNVLSLWNLSPFPSLVRIPEFPKACIDDVKVTTRSFKAQMSGKNIYDEDHRQNLLTVKKMTIDEKIEFWREIMQYAADRCIKIFLFTWNLFVYGTEDSGYGLTDDQNDPRTRDYIYYGTKALLDTYPLLAGIGVTAGENMTFNGSADADSADFDRTDIGFIRKTYGRAVEDYLAEHPDRDLTLIHRTMMAKYDSIRDAYRDFKGRFELSFKYSQAHMYSDPHPGFIRDLLAAKDPDTKIWLTVRNDDFYLFRWGDPDYAREYLAGMPAECMQGFYLGADGFTWGRDYTDRKCEDGAHPLFLAKMWYSFYIWGRLAYDERLDNAHLNDALRQYYQLQYDEADRLRETWAMASRIIPMFNCIHWHDFDFQWYPEGCCMYLHSPIDKLVFANINEFVSCPAMPYTKWKSAKETAKELLAGIEPDRYSALTVAKRIRELVQKVDGEMDYVWEFNYDREYEKALEDIFLMIYLGQYYSLKEEAAVYLAAYRMSGRKELQETAVGKLEAAAAWWRKFTDLHSDNYYPQLFDRLCGRVDVTEFEELVDLDIELAKEG